MEPGQKVVKKIFPSRVYTVLATDPFKIKWLGFSVEAVECRYREESVVIPKFMLRKLY